MGLDVERITSKYISFINCIHMLAVTGSRSVVVSYNVHKQVKLTVKG